MTSRTARGVVLALALASPMVLFAPAVAEEEPPVTGGPVGTGGEFVDIDPGYYEPFGGPACGSTVTVTPGDVREVQVRVTELPNGDVRTEYRGAATVDVSRESDGAVLDELDVSGAAFEISSGEPTEEGVVVVTVGLEGASILLPFDEVQAESWAAAGLPEVVYYPEGQITIQDVLQLSEDEAEPPATIESVVLSSTATGVQDVCDLLDEVAAG